MGLSTADVVEVSTTPAWRRRLLAGGESLDLRGPDGAVLARLEAVGTSRGRRAVQVLGLAVRFVLSSSGWALPPDGRSRLVDPGGSTLLLLEVERSRLRMSDASDRLVAQVRHVEGHPLSFVVEDGEGRTVASVPDTRPVRRVDRYVPVHVVDAAGADLADVDIVNGQGLRLRVHGDPDPELRLALVGLAGALTRPGWWRGPVQQSSG